MTPRVGTETPSIRYSPFAYGFDWNDDSPCGDGNAFSTFLGSRSKTIGMMIPRKGTEKLLNFTIR